MKPHRRPTRRFQFLVFSSRFLVFFRHLSLLITLFLAACGTAAPATPAALALPARIIGFWSPETGTLNAGEAQPWRFIAESGDVIRVQVSGSAAVTLTLDSPDGVRLAEGTDQIEASLSSGGIYSITVTAIETTQYEISLIYTDRPNPADYTPTPLPVTIVPTSTPLYYEQLGTFISLIRSGETLERSFVQRDERHVYTFEGQAGQYINAQAVRISGGVDPVLTLYAPSGGALAADDNSGGAQTARLRSVRLPGDALYTLQIVGQGTGTYQLNLLTTSNPVPLTPNFPAQPIPPTLIPEVVAPTLAAAISGDPLTDHVPIIGNIERAGDFDRYPFQAASGDILTVSIRLPDGSGLNPLLEVFDPLGALVASTSGVDGVIGALQVSETGTYQVFVAGENNTTGTYIVAYGRGFSSEESRRGMTIADQTYSGEIARQGLRETWSLDLNPGDVISAAAGSLDLNFDPVLELVAPDGSTIAMDDNSGGGLDALIASAHAPIAGRYTLRVTSANALGDGAYSLVWRLINLAPTATPLPGTAPIMIFNDRITEGTYQFYPFYGEAGMSIRVQAIAAPGGNLDPVAVLIAPDGTQLVEGDDSEGDLNPRFTATLPTDGTYMVRVNGYLSSGDFTLTVEQLFEASSAP
ncbi:MAG: hypothetical protein K8L97_31840 [Anaerolineae bacterium]|nr:hypothetical protein [Anaerolineae bacterium]